MLKFSVAAALAVMSLSSAAFAGSTAEERLGRVLSILGQNGVSNVSVDNRDGQTIVRGTQNGRSIEVRVEREDTVEQPRGWRRHSGKRRDANLDEPRKQTRRAAAAATKQAAADPTPEEAGKIDRLANETGLPKSDPTKPGDGLRDLPRQDVGAVYDTKDAGTGSKQPSFGLGQLDLAKGPRSGPALAPAQ